MEEHEAFEHEVDEMGRYDISSSGSLFDALNDLQMALCAEPEAASTVDTPGGRWTVDHIEVVETPEAPVVRTPEARTPRRSAPGLEPRARRQQPQPQPEAQIPSVLDRIAAMPRVRSTSGIAHPTGEAWLAPTQRQFCGRPPV